MPLPIAFALSLAFHLALYDLAGRAGLHAPAPTPPRPVIEAMLILPEIAVPPPAVSQPAAAQPPVAAPAAVAPAPTRQPPRPPAAARPAIPRSELKPAAAAPLFYPREAVLRGLEGEALVSVTLDAHGRVIAARLERGSGHAILDDAAVAAALSLKSLPGGGREATLPVRFRLK